jgi:hypothetical protein
MLDKPLSKWTVKELQAELKTRSLPASVSLPARSFAACGPGARRSLTRND